MAPALTLKAIQGLKQEKYGRVIHTTESTGAGGGRGEGGSRGRRYMDIHIVIRQKPTQHYKAIILQLEKKKELKV